MATGITSLAQEGLPAQSLNSLSEVMAQAFATQATINQQVWGALFNLQQQIDLIQEDLDNLWQVSHTQCDIRYAAICVMPIPVRNASWERKKLANLLKGPFSQAFLNSTYQLQREILKINNTRVKPVEFSFLSDALSRLTSWLNPDNIFIWAVLATGSLLAFTLFHCFYSMIQRIDAQQAMIVHIQQGLIKRETGRCGKSSGDLSQCCGRSNAVSTLQRTDFLGTPESGNTRLTNLQEPPTLSPDPHAHWIT
ncbi:uncharacterized protein LOC132224123 [Myotis daubentonii]|uniref:uncharacterized protein LOC132224123 n=1 Tax=Myotis daubentonii TaxID=98922 RepID=UPI002872FC04|nr:uncharacterized protein LOC132224123 [Myotis daubentonii]